MTRRASRLALVAWLTVVWVGLWGSVTVANVLGGVVVSLVLVVLLPPEPSPGPAVLAPVPLLRFAVRFLADLVVSSVQVVRLVLRPRIALRQAIVSVQVPGASDTLLTVLADAISLTPGTLTVDVDPGTGTLYVHVLDVGPGTRGVERVRADLQDQARAAVRALGSADARAHVRSSAAAAGDRRREGGR